jgi:hypothetical protein
VLQKKGNGGGIGKECRGEARSERIREVNALQIKDEHSEKQINTEQNKRYRNISRMSEQRIPDMVLNMKVKGKRQREGGRGQDGKSGLGNMLKRGNVECGKTLMRTAVGRQINGEPLLSDGSPEVGTSCRGGSGISAFAWNDSAKRRKTLISTAGFLT